jgi:class 3 adenylate cyclase
MFDLRAGTDTATYLLSVTCSRNHLYAIRAGYLAQHITAINRTSLWNAIFIGIALLLALYHVFLFFAIRNVPYLYYVGLVICFGLFNAYVSGSAFLYLWPEHPWINRYDNVASCAAGVFGGLFTVASLGLQERAPRLSRIIYLFAAVYLVDIFIALAGYSFVSFRILRSIVPFSLVCTISAAITVYRGGYKPARFFLLAWSVMAASIIAFMFNGYGSRSYHFIGTHALQIGSLIEALILSFALADRFNSYRKEKETLIIMQNELLEQQVAVRTEELQKQQRESEQLLLNILPEEVAAELKQNGVARSRNYEAVTVLFTDFKDFTLIAAHMSPEQLIGELNHCFSAFDKITEKYGIEKIKTIGDSYMCAGGFGGGDSESVLNVVKAGIEIRDFMNERNRTEEMNGGKSFEVRIGIHTGPVIAGIIGIKKFAYDIWGDTVNIASRMESAGEPGRVNISGFTYQQVSSYFVCTHRGRIPAKSKGEVDMYFVERK